MAYRYWMRFEPSATRRHVRRWLALGILLAYAASAAEAVVGVVRDGEVHHESTVAAAVHRAEHQSEHGYQHVDHGTHDADHGHDGSSDHCTHLHGVSVPAACSVEVSTGSRSVTVALATPSPTDRTPESDFRPPRA